MNSEMITCPMCRGYKKVFQKGLFLKAQESYCRGKGPKPRLVSFVRDCSVCAGNGWVSRATIQAAKTDAESWRSDGVYGL